MRVPALRLRPKLGPFEVGQIQLAFRAALAAGVSMTLARLFDLEFPIYAMLAAVIVTDLAPEQTRQLGKRRLVATVVGAVCGAALSSVLAPGPWTVGLAILLAMVLCQLLKVHDAAKVAGYICGIVVLSHGAERWSYAWLRLLETTLGIGVAWAISLMPKLIRSDDGT